MADTPNGGIETSHDLTPEFNHAANPPEVTKEAKPTAELRPPGPMGPGLGSISQETGQERNVSPQLRDQVPAGPSVSPTMKQAFNQAARAGALRAVFERKANERSNDNGLDR